MRIASAQMNLVLHLFAYTLWDNLSTAQTGCSMVKTFNIAVFEGDGIGPEIMEPTVGILQAISQRSDAYALDFATLPAGAAHYAKTGESLPEDALRKARAADAILLSAMGLPSVRYPDGTEISPQMELRFALDLYAGLRPVRVAPGQESPR